MNGNQILWDEIFLPTRKQLDMRGPMSFNFFENESLTQISCLHIMICNQLNVSDHDYEKLLLGLHQVKKPYRRMVQLEMAMSI